MSPPTKRSRVSFGTPRIDGTVDGSTIAATLRGQRPAFERCHAEASEERGTGPGRVLLEIALHPDGSVAKVRSLPKSQEILDGTDLDDPVFIDCLRQKVRGMRFAQPENPTRIRITLAFAPPKSPRDGDHRS